MQDSENISPGVPLGYSSRKSHSNDARRRSRRTVSHVLCAISKSFRLAPLPHFQVRRRHAADSLSETVADGTGQGSVGVEFSQCERDRLPGWCERREPFRPRLQGNVWIFSDPLSSTFSNYSNRGRRAQRQQRKSVKQDRAVFGTSYE